MRPSSDLRECDDVGCRDVVGCSYCILIIIMMIFINPDGDSLKLSGE